MRKSSLFYMFFCSLLLLTAGSGFVTPVLAGAPANIGFRTGSVITLVKPNDPTPNQSFKVASMNNNLSGQSGVDKPVTFTQFSKTLNAGTYMLGASHKDRDFAAFPSSTSMGILPNEVQIQVVPPISGIVFEINGKKFISGADGLASVQINEPGEYKLYVLLDEYDDPSQHIEFGRWLAEESYELYQNIQVPTHGVIALGLNVYNLVGQSFVDLDGSPVSSERIKKVSFRSTQGDLFDFPDGQPRWIPASRIARRINGLEQVNLLYSVLNVTVDGSNVVNQAQQRFYAHPNEIWSISLLFYSLQVNATDALFGFSVGKSVDLKFPDGQIKNYPLSETGAAEIHSLARGDYSIEFKGTNGLANPTPIALSRNQEVNTKIITYLDLATVGLLGALVMLGLLIYGRPSIVGFLRKNDQSVKSQSFS
jgi:hypothetical protein